MTFAFLSFGGGEIFIVFLAVLLLFGADKIPELFRTFGKGMNEFRKATDEIKREFREGTKEFEEDLKESNREIKDHVRELKSSVEEADGYDPYIDIDDPAFEDGSAMDELENSEPRKKSDQNKIED